MTLTEFMHDANEVIAAEVVGFDLVTLTPLDLVRQAYDEERRIRLSRRLVLIAECAEKRRRIRMEIENVG